MNKIRSFSLPSWSAPLALLAACAFSYAVLLPALGFSWDDWAFNWIAQGLGDAGLRRYFATNRPFYGELVILTARLLGGRALGWHLFALTWRWLATVALWGTLRLVWRKQEQAALWVSLLFAVYPGAVQQYIAIVFSQFFIILSAFFGSLLCSLLALRHKRLAWLLTPVGMLLALVNLLALDYFFLLELLRPLLLWFALADTPSLKERLRRCLLGWAPYLVVFAGVGVWRAFFFKFQTQNYRPLLLEQLKTNPLGAVFDLLRTVALDLYTTSLGAWGQVLQVFQGSTLGMRVNLVSGLAALALFGLLLLYLLRYKAGEQTLKNWREPWAIPALLAGLLGMLLAGVPYWVTQTAVHLAYPNNRLTLSFMLGASLFTGGLLGLIPLPRWVKLSALALFTALAAGLHTQTAAAFARDWNMQNAFFWQLSWRAPAITPNTILISTNLPVNYSTDNSLTAPLNWIYAAPGSGESLPYLLSYPSVRQGGSLPEEITPGVPVKVDYLAATFSGSTSQAVALAYQPPACLRVLDPDLDPLNPQLPQAMRQAAALSQARLILTQAETPAVPPPAIFDPEPAHGWCYYYEKADLARQQGDWPAVVQLADKAFALNDYPNDPAERYPYIEGYAHTGNWSKALELSRTSADVSTLFKPVLCRLWQRIESQTAPTSERNAALKSAYAEFECN